MWCWNLKSRKWAVPDHRGRSSRGLPASTVDPAPKPPPSLVHTGAQRCGCEAACGCEAHPPRAKINAAGTTIGMAEACQI